MSKRRERYIVKYLRSGNTTEIMVLCKSPRKVKKCLKSLDFKNSLHTYEWIKVIDTKKCTNDKEKSLCA